MDTPMKKVSWSPHYGIAARHWTRLAAYAAQKQLFLFVRGGKASAIPWIEHGFPGKPMELGFLKVEERTGLLWAVTSDARQRVFDAQHYVLQRVGGGYRAVGRAGTPTNLRTYFEPWAGAGVVVERQSGLPFTSDYDLAAVIPSAQFDYIQDVAGFMLGKSRTSQNAEKVRADLNREFGSTRFRHGPQALYDQKLGHGDDELIIAFCANGDVFAFRTPETEAAAVMQYRELLVAIQPQHAASFNN